MIDFFKKRRTWSLAHQQWFGLGLLTLFVLSFVSALIYGLTKSHLEDRQQETLQSTSELVRYLLSEDFNSEHQPALLRRPLFRSLDNQFLGHNDLSLLIFDQDQKLLYQTRYQVPPNPAATLRFQIAFHLMVIDVELSLDKNHDEQLLHQLAWILVACSLLGSCIFAFGGCWLIAYGIRPVAHLTQQIRALHPARLSERLDDTGQPEELRPVVAQFNTTLERLEEAYRHLEAFNSNVAHELNTPLATLITSIEVALRKPHAPATLRDLAEANLEELQRISAMIKDMLFLAQADRGVLARRTFVPSLKTLAQSVVEYQEAMLEEAELCVQIEGDAAGDVDAPLLKRALSNLLSNAIRYAYPKSTITLAIAQKDEELCLTLINRGELIDEAHLPKLFNRFYRATSSRTCADHHYGLGLSIVSAVAKMHGGTPFANSNEKGTHIGFSLTLTKK